MRSHPQIEGDVNVPSCAALKEIGLESYYANVNMLMVEAWVGKILPALRTLAVRDATSPVTRYNEIRTACAREARPCHVDTHFATWTQAGDAGSDRDVVTASLLRVGADATAAGDLGGAIFIAELRPDKSVDKSAEKFAEEKSALMLGIHRTPRHKVRPSPYALNLPRVIHS